MIITFIGHRTIYNQKELYEKIKRVIIQNIQSSEYVLFYCGGRGDFDNLCEAVCHSVKKDGVNCEIVYVTPYITKSEQNKMNNEFTTEKFDSIIYPPLEHIPLRLAIKRRNEWMIERADLVIAYVEHEYGGAYNGVCFAHKKKKKVINLAQ